jgi:hypothetical protein
MTRRKTKSRSGPTISPEERRIRGYGRVTYSLPTTTRDLVERYAVRHGTTLSAVIVLAIGALIEVEGLPD